MKRPTSKDVAALAGVSPTTVSFVLNERAGANISPETRRRVLAAAGQLGYQPHAAARGLAGGRSHTIGLVLRQSAEQVAEDALLAETLRGISGAARAAGFRVLVEPFGDGATYGDLLRARRADGIIVSGPRDDDPELAELAALGAPVVLQGSAPKFGLPSVDVDNVAASVEAVRHLIAYGHRRIACITNAPMRYTAAQDRLEGYRLALAEAGIRYDRRLVHEADFGAASGRQAMAELLDRGTFTAAFVASDVVAFGAIAALREAGLRVPDDVSVVGFDDIPLAGYFDPPMTTVRLPAHDLGRAVGVALLDRIAGRAVQARTVLATELVIRSSTGMSGPSTVASSGRPGHGATGR
jgi:DNA-binding LacI/PurR family transcriptional regulator